MKKKKIFLNILASIFLIAGVSLLGIHYYNEYIQKQTVEKIKEDFLLSLSDPVEPSDDEEKKEITAWGLLTIDSVGIELPITIADNFDDLYSSLIAYDSAPVPPEPGNFTVAGHNGSCPVCTFRYLHDVENGDLIEVMSVDHIMTYEVYETLEVLNTETWVLDDVEGETTLSLLTCKYSSWTNPWRLIVRARLINVEEN